MQPLNSLGSRWWQLAHVELTLQGKKDHHQSRCHTHSPSAKSWEGKTCCMAFWCPCERKGLRTCKEVQRMSSAEVSKLESRVFCFFFSGELLGLGEGAVVCIAYGDQIMVSCGSESGSENRIWGLLLSLVGRPTLCVPLGVATTKVQVTCNLSGWRLNWEQKCQLKIRFWFCMG